MAGNAFNLELTDDDIMTVKADAVVSSIHRSKDMEKGPLAKHVLSTCGDQVQRELSKMNGDGDLTFGKVVVTSPGSTSGNFMAIFHVCLFEWRDGNDSTLYKSVWECLVIATKRGYETVAFPALGMGGNKYPPFVVATTMMLAMVDYFETYPETSVRKVIICLQHKDQSTLRAFFQAVLAFSMGYKKGTIGKTGYTLNIQDRLKGLERTLATRQENQGCSICGRILQLFFTTPNTPMLSKTFMDGKASIDITPDLNRAKRSASVTITVSANFSHLLPSFLQK